MRRPEFLVAASVGALALLAAVARAGAAAPGAGDAPASGGAAMTFTLTSPSFEANAEIPKKHTCDGEDVSPALVWSGAPETTKSFALVVDDPDAPDPDAPRTIWVHWVLYNIPGWAKALPEAARKMTMPLGTREGSNDWGRPTWGGPCPPIGRHRYFFKLYALDTEFQDLGTLTKTELERVMKGHVLAHAELVGTYKKSRK